MSDALWPNAAVVQQHYTKDWTRHPVYILDREKRHPLYNREALREGDSVAQSELSAGHRSGPGRGSSRSRGSESHRAPRRTSGLDRGSVRRRESGPSELYLAIARERRYPDRFGALPYEPDTATRREPDSKPSPRAIGRCRVTYPAHQPSQTFSVSGHDTDAAVPPREPSGFGLAPRHSRDAPEQPPSRARPMPGRATDATIRREPRTRRALATPTRPSPTSAPVREPETVSLLHPTGKFAEKVAGVRRLREWDEKIPQEHLPRRRWAWRILHRFIPWLTIVKRCRECEQSWPCHPLRANLQRRYGGDITTRLHALSTKKLRTQTQQRSPTATRHRAWTPRTWYGRRKTQLVRVAPRLTRGHTLR